VWRVPGALRLPAQARESCKVRRGRVGQPVPLGIAVDTGGSILAAGVGLVWEIDPVTGARTIISSPGGFPCDLTVDLTGDLIVGDLFSRVFRIDPATGIDTTISSGGLFGDACGVVLEASGDIVVAERRFNQIVRIDPLSGSQELGTTVPDLGEHL